MGKRIEVPITPKVLEWAIAESGFSLAEVGESVEGGVATLRSWLNETARPSLGEMRRVARKLHRQLATFLLPKPPSSRPVTVKFRNPMRKGTRPLNRIERRYLRRARWLQEGCAWLAGELGRGPVALPRWQLTDDSRAAAKVVRGLLKVTLAQQREWESPSKAFDAWRKALEDLGVIVLLFPMGEESCRGFSLWHPTAPLMAINTAWIDVARIFTMFHELGHLVTRTDSACAATVTTADPKDRAERWCERFASETLLSMSVPDRRAIGRKTIQERELGPRVILMFVDAVRQGVIAESEARNYLGPGSQNESFIGHERA